MKFDSQTIKNIVAFEEFTGASVVDSLPDKNVIFFVIKEGQMGLAIGKNGKNIKQLQNLLGKRIVAFEHFEEPNKFVRNAIPNIRDIKIDEGNITICIRKDNVNNTMGKNIEIIRQFLERLYNITKIKLVRMIKW